MDLEKLLPIVEESLLTLIDRRKHQHDDVMAFLTETIVNLNPIALMSNSALDALSDQVFRNEAVRDFVLEMTYHVYSRVKLEIAPGLSNGDLVPVLVEQISLQDIRANSYSLVPTALKERLLSKAMIEEFLTDNPWLVVCLLLNLINFQSTLKKYQRKE